MDEQKFPDIFDSDNSTHSYSYHTKNKLERSYTNFILTGVCAGLSKYLNIDPALIRLVGILSLLLGEWSIIVYSAASIFIPLEIAPQKISMDDQSKIRTNNIKTVISGVTITMGVYYGMILFGLYDYNSFSLLPEFIVISLSIVVIGFQIITQITSSIYHTNELPRTFFKTRNNKIFLGVCGGSSKYFGIDATIARFLFVIISIITLGIGIIIYFLFGLTTSFEDDGLTINEL